MRRTLVLAALAAWPGAAGAAALTVAKAAVVVSDGVSAANPKALPGATIDYTVQVGSPSGNLGSSVGAVTVIETVSANAALRVADLGSTGSGPIEFTDGNLLGTGLLASGLGYSFAGLASTADGIDFSTDGVTWTYTPVPDANGCDANVRAIRIRLSGTQAASSAFRLRYRVRLL